MPEVDSGEFDEGIELVSHFGFVAGCQQDEDDAWKIQFLDLSEVEQGILKRDKRFGRIVLPDKCVLESAISVRSIEKQDDNEHYVRIAVELLFNLRTGEIKS